MAAVGPPQQVRMAQQQVWAALEVALRVPCLYIIDAIFNSYYDSSQSRFCIGLQIFLRLLGGAVIENPPANEGDTGSIPAPGRSHMPRSN
ncbi:E3 ubiquitin-protein ligase RNF139 isoform X2 [Hippopotamus amphibius kiboko]|uniref:E3 ubiquitin-protein ligase RNF139 isoform X2 n=1 Tax=Hippopotamus amphibius kiboko TaxID=575201 RepID=UPI002597B760|nr:E3 ubiquitin-protein ligase RNF139 isoform X2 [Hippopotamus amphibius kiboko]